MAAFDGEAMALINAIHQLGSSNAIIDSATEMRSMLTILRQIYRGNVTHAGFDDLQPPLPMYHPWPYDIPRATQLHNIMERLADSMDQFGEVCPSRLSFFAAIPFSSIF